MTNVTLATDFPEPTLADWQKKVEAGLRDLTLSDIVQKTEDGLVRGPLSTQAERPDTIASPPRLDAPCLEGRSWHITAPVTGPEIAHANQQMLDDLKGGASAVRVQFDNEGLRLRTQADVNRLFDQVYTDLIPITFAGNITSALPILHQSKILQSAAVTIELCPLVHREIIADAVESAPSNWRIVSLSALSTHNAGATAVQELADIAGLAVWAMKLLGADTASRNISITLAVDQDAHQTIAKIRAVRRIYARIAESFGLKETAVPIHAVSSKRMMQAIDPWTNLLRIMSAGFGAVVGGADYITTLPFTEAIGNATPFGHRIARNMQVMMMDESHLGQVRDPAYGSYFHERVTHDLAKASWEEFQRIEAIGGIKPYYASGAAHRTFEKERLRREKHPDPILGVTLHPYDNGRTAKTRAVKS